MYEYNLEDENGNEVPWPKTWSSSLPMQMGQRVPFAFRVVAVHRESEPGSPGRIAVVRDPDITFPPTR
jgi:hypothetical protein